MSHHQPIRDAQDIARWYGSDSQFEGVCIDHVHLINRDFYRTLSNGFPVAVSEKTGVAYKVLCGHLIEVYTEDGPTDGRCGHRVETDKAGACPGHAQWRDSIGSYVDSMGMNLLDYDEDERY